MSFKVTNTDAWPQPRDLAQLEAALAGGRLYARMGHKRYWLCTRAGRTEHAGDLWRVPIRAGLNAYAWAQPGTLHAYRMRPVGTRPSPPARPVGRP